MIEPLTELYSEPDLPAMPYEVVAEEDRFREAGVETQTHVTVTWTVADAEGNQLYMNKKISFIHVSDDGSAEMVEPNL